MRDHDYKDLYLSLVGRLEGWAVMLDRETLASTGSSIGPLIAAELRRRMTIPADLPRRETSASIAQWQRETFGEAMNNMSSYRRARKEFNELYERLMLNDNDPSAPVEIADIAIVLSRIVAFHGKDLQDAIDAKMAINRARKWKLTGDGHGQHVEDEP